MEVWLYTMRLTVGQNGCCIKENNMKIKPYNPVYARPPNRLLRYEEMRDAVGNALRKILKKRIAVVGKDVKTNTRPQRR